MKTAALVAAFALTSFGCREQGTSAVPQRVVTLAPSLTEIVFALGRGDRLVGVSDFCEHPPEVKRRARVGGLLNPNVERILSLRPDLVVVVSDFPQARDRLREAGIRTLSLRAESLQDLDRSIEALGKALGATGAAGRLRRSLQRDLDAVRASVRGRPRPRVLYVLDRRHGTIQDVFVAGGRSYLTDLVEVGGGRSVTADVDKGVLTLSTERLIALAPDILLDATRDPAGLAPWRTLASLPAVQEGRLVDASDPIFTIPSPRIVGAAYKMRRWLHPEVASAE